MSCYERPGELGNGDIRLMITFHLLTYLRFILLSAR